MSKLFTKRLNQAYRNQSICRLHLLDGDVCVGFVRDFDGEFIELKSTSVVLNNIEPMGDDEEPDHRIADRLVRVDAVIQFEQDCSHALRPQHLNSLLFYRKTLLQPWYGKELKGKLSEEDRACLNRWMNS